MPRLSALLVDDDDFVRSTVSQQLRTAGVDRVVTAADGHLALRAVQCEGPFDLIISDLVLPGLDGIEMLRDLAVSQPASAVVLISALDETVLRAAAVLARQRGLRALGALRKPIRQEALLRLVHSIVQSPQAGETAPACAAGDALQIGLDRGEIRLRALPRLCLRQKRLAGAELRLQWHTAGGDAFSQASIFRTAGRSRLSARLTDYMLARAAQAAADCWASGLHVPLGLSLPMAALQRLELPDLIDGQLREHNLLPQSLQLGFPESAVTDDEQALDILTRLRMRGIGVCIDEFGGSHCGFLQIQRVPATQVRIDAQLLRLGSTGERLLGHLLQTAASLGFEVLGDDVRDERECSRLAQSGCTLVQGPHIGAPVDPPDLPAAAGELGRAAEDVSPSAESCA